MKRTVYADGPAMVRWAQERLGVSFGPLAQAIGLERDGAIIAVEVFHRFSDWDCEMSIVAAPNWGGPTRDFLRRIFAFPFVQLGLERVSASVALDNVTVLRWMIRLGFRQEGMAYRLPPAVHVLRFGMLRTECRWVPASLLNVPARNV